MTTFFGHRPVKSDDLFNYRLVTTPTLYTFQRRLFGCHPLDGVSLGGPPPGDAKC